MNAKSEHSIIASRIVSGLNRHVQSVEFLAKGSTSEVWLATADQLSFVVRLAEPHAGKTVCFEGEAGLRAALLQFDSRVARSIATSTTHPHIDTGGIEWAVDSFIAGDILTRGALPKTVCRDLGELLAKLHSIPAQKYGLLRNQRDAIIGQVDNVIDGICTRLQDPWPFYPADLHDHPIAQAAPHLLPRIEAHKNQLLELTIDQPCVPLHTDLHEHQMPTIDGRLNGLLDFGDAMIGPVVCDIGSFMGFHGRSQTEWLLESYTSRATRRKELLDQAHLWGIVVSLHHASRAVTLNRPERMARVIKYLDENLGY